jgi:hypothetical protein
MTLHRQRVGVSIGTGGCPRCRRRVMFNPNPIGPPRNGTGERAFFDQLMVRAVTLVTHLRQPKIEFSFCKRNLIVPNGWYIHFQLRGDQPVKEIRKC